MGKYIFSQGKVEKNNTVLDLFGIGLTDSGSRMIGLTKGMTPPADSILPFDRDDDNRADGDGI